MKNHDMPKGIWYWVLVVLAWAKSQCLTRTSERQFDPLGSSHFPCIDDRSGAIAIFIALVLPIFIFVMALAIDVASWEAAKVSVQRTADVAANAGIMAYKNTKDPQKAALAAMQLAQMNGVMGSVNPAWNSSTNTLTSGNITVQLVSGLLHSSNTAINVSVSAIKPAVFGGFAGNLTQVAITASSTAELMLVPNASASGGQPCVVALAGIDGITIGIDLLVNGLATIIAPNCTLRSNDATSLAGIDTVTAQAIYSGGAFLNIGLNTVKGPIYTNQGQIADPYAGNTALQAALSTANNAVGSGLINCLGVPVVCSGPTGSVSCNSGNCTLQPGIYSSLIATGTGTLRLSPGLYTFVGSIVVSGALQVTASNVTILQAATSLGLPTSIVVSGLSTLVLTAATASDATNGQLSGVAFASQSAGVSALIGAGSSPQIGLIYYPKGSFNVTVLGNTGSGGCFEVIASTIIISGWLNFDASSCVSSYGLTSFGSTSGTLQARLVR